jgi:phosphoglycerate dehydrogenase-like enzyme
VGEHIPVSGNKTIVILDGLFDDLGLEQQVAAANGWTVARWDNSDAMLRTAEVVVHVRTKIDRALLDRLPVCRVVGRFGTGLDTVDRPAAAERGIRVVGIRDYCVPELASHTLGLAFALDRRLDAIRAGRLAPDASWQEVAQKQPMPGRTAATVIGLGSIGRAVTRALVALGITVKVVTAHGAAEARALGAEDVPLDKGLAGAEFVFLHAALSDATAGMIDAARLALLPPHAIIVNTARIGLMNEADVAAALDAGRLAGLGLDAKLAPDSPLRRYVTDERLLLTPHVGWYSERSARELRRRTIQESIDAYNESIGGNAGKVGEKR